MKLKRDVLDALDALYSFELPQRLVDAEFNGIWTTLDQGNANGRQELCRRRHHRRRRARNTAPSPTRRVRLGLVLGTVGEKRRHQVNDQELQRLMVERARQFPARKKMFLTTTARTRMP